MKPDKQNKDPERERPADKSSVPARVGHSGSGSGSALKQLKKWERMRAALGFKPRESPSDPERSRGPQQKG